MYIRPLASSVKQGLDLQGGTHVVLQAVDTPQLKVNDDALDRATNIIERRVNALGLTEPVVQRQGRDRIIVELPGVKDPEKAINMLGKTAMLEFKDPNDKTVLTGTDLKDAKAVIGNGNQPLVSMEFSDEGGKKFADALQFCSEEVTVDEDGWADFRCEGGHVSIWVMPKAFENLVVNA